eukprot:2255662-Amphidinium_carterae.1
MPGHVFSCLFLCSRNLTASPVNARLRTNSPYLILVSRCDVLGDCTNFTTPPRTLHGDESRLS